VDGGGGSAGELLEGDRSYEVSERALQRWAKTRRAEGPDPPPERSVAPSQLLSRAL